MTTAALIAANAGHWAKMKVLDSHIGALDHVAARLVAPAAKARYEGVQKSTGVPWFVIAVIHEREASQSWGANIAQGDPYSRRSVHVPAGRGPFSSWEAAAFDALVHCAPYAARWKDWSAGGALTLLEEYNGLGYARRGLPSPYIWASSNQYKGGKYVSDGHFDPHAWDTQLGCAPMLNRMMLKDKSITFGGHEQSAPAPSIDQDLRWAQKILNALDNAGLVVDGISGPKTKAAVIAFQKEHSLLVDGILGDQTRAALEAAYDHAPETHGPVGAEA